jgi:hypothetical protein
MENKTYRVRWHQITHCWATVNAKSEKEAIEKAKRGENNDDVDTDAGPEVMKSYTCDGLA